MSKLDSSGEFGRFFGPAAGATRGKINLMALLLEGTEREREESAQKGRGERSRETISRLMEDQADKFARMFPAS